MDVDVKNYNGVKHVTIAPKNHIGEWVNLGTYSFNASDKNEIIINGSKTDGPIFADAVLLRPKK